LGGQVVLKSIKKKKLKTIELWHFHQIFIIFYYSYGNVELFLRIEQDIATTNNSVGSGITVLCQA